VRARLLQRPSGRRFRFTTAEQARAGPVEHFLVPALDQREEAAFKVLDGRGQEGSNLFWTEANGPFLLLNPHDPRTLSAMGVDGPKKRSPFSSDYVP